MPFAPWANPVASPYWFLAFCPPQLWDRERRTWGYELDFVSVLGGRTVVKSVAIKRSNGFLLTNVAALVTTDQNPPVLIFGSGFNANGLQPSNFLMQLTATKRKYDLFSLPVPLDNVCGAGSMSPGIPVPLYLEAGEVLNVQMQSLWPASNTNRTVRLTLGGLIFV